MNLLKIFAVAALAMVAAACNKSDADLISQIEGKYSVVIEWENGVEVGNTAEYLLLEDNRMLLTITTPSGNSMHAACTIEGEDIIFGPMGDSSSYLSVTLFLDPAQFKDGTIATNIIMRAELLGEVKENHGRIIFRKK